MAVRLYLEEGRIRLTSADGDGEATVEAETKGEAKIALNNRYLAQALRALGGMAEVAGAGPLASL